MSKILRTDLEAERARLDVPHSPRSQLTIEVNMVRADRGFDTSVEFLW
jgi:hypothetical protein